MKAVFFITESKNYVQPSTQVQKYLAAQNSKLQLHSAGFLFYFIWPKRPYCSGLGEPKPQSHLQALYFPPCGWTSPNCRSILQVLNLLRTTEKGPHCRGLKKVQTAKPSASLLFPSVKLEKLKLHLLKEPTTSRLVKLLFVTTRHQ